MTADIAGYFLHIDIDELERHLLAVSDKAEAIRDLAEMLRTWQVLGIRGLPQGVRPSSPLGNIYLRPMDRLLVERGVPFVRWMDDFVLAAPSFNEARRIQGEMERILYEFGMTLAADKTRILRWDRAIEETRGQRFLKPG